MIVTKGRLDEVRQVTAFLVQKPQDRLQIFEFLAALGEGLRNTLSSLTLANPDAGLDRVFSAAMESAIDGSSPPSVRAQAIRLISVSSLSFADASDWLVLLCNPQPWLDVRSAAVATVAHYDDPGAVVGLLDRWRTFPPVLRNQAVASLLSRRSHVPAVLEAVEKSRLSVADFSSAQLNFLRTYPDAQVSERANRLFGPLTVHRPGVMDLFRPALRLTGVRDRGQATFSAQCAGCHQASQGGQRLGPNLAEMRPRGKEQLLEAIIEPNARVSEQYATSVVQTGDGDNLVGIKSDDNLSSLTLRQPGGEGVVCPRLNVRSVRTESWSLMPEGLEQGLSTQDMADLLAFLITATP
ncbi:MAG: c-type cytochrome [Limisphaerales bacterium]